MTGRGKRPLPPAAAGRVLIVQLGQLGDVVASRVALLSLAAARPDARLEMVVREDLAPLVEAEPACAAVHAYPRAPGALQVARLALRLRRPRPELVVDLTGSTRSRWLSVACGARRRAGWGRRWLYAHGTEDRRRTAANYTLEIARLVASLGVEPRLELPPPPVPEPTAELRLLLERLGPARPIVLHPGASNPIRHWRGVRFARLAESLVSLGQRVLLVVGPAERGLADALAAECSAPLPVHCARSAGELTAVLAGARLLVALDSGPMHLAAALGVPTVALFGPNVPQRAGPPRGPVEFLGVELPCRPCRQVLAHCVLPEYNCMDRIEVETVVRRVLARLAGTEPRPPTEAHGSSDRTER